MIKLSSVKIPYREIKDNYIDYAARSMKTSKDNILSCRLLKRSLDARRPDNIHYVCSFKIKVKSENKILKNKKTATSIYNNKPYEFPYKNINTKDKIAIIGSGPSGLFCGLMLARAGLCPVIFERGEEASKRIESINSFNLTSELNPDSNIQFGEGGAGTFSDGKLTCGVNDERMEYILREFAIHGAPDDILTNAKPHIGTDYLPIAIENIRKEIEKLGGKVIFNARVYDIDIKNNKVEGISYKNTKNGTESYEKCDCIIAAIGHSSRDTYEMLLNHGFAMERKPFSIGVRIEHKREYINMLQYKEAFLDEALPTADYKLSCHLPVGSCYSFCMCPGGEVVCGASEENALVTNGMSRFARDAVNSNSALLVSVTPEDIPGGHVLGGMYYQRELEVAAFKLGGGGYYAPYQRVEDFIKGVKTTKPGSVSPSYKPGVTPTDLNELLPSFIAKTLKAALVEFDKKMPGFNFGDAILTAIETRSSAPVRIKRDDSYESNIKGFYPIGEGAGYAGGIMSSAADGIKCAERICCLYL